jgi:hypothetical protein
MTEDFIAVIAKHRHFASRDRTTARVTGTRAFVHDGTTEETHHG